MRDVFAILCGSIALAFGLHVAAAAPVNPTRDDEVIEVLPAPSGVRAEDRQLRRRLAQQPDNVALALQLARRDLAMARADGDPRWAGMALAALAHWSDSIDAPLEVLLERATLQQYLHDFDASIATLRVLLARPRGAANAEAWLTLASVLRVRGDYPASDTACRGVAEAGARLHAAACLAENNGLRGDNIAARRTFHQLLAEPHLDPAVRQWLLTSVAEMEERDASPQAADAAYRAALALGPDAYARIAYADFLIAQRRPREAVAVLREAGRADAVVLRLAIAGTQAGTADAARDVDEMRERIALSNQRPNAAILHGREQAMFALRVDRAPARALELARGNVAHQREPIDVLVFAQAAAAAGDRAALDELRRLVKSMSLRDRRIDAIVS